jgi:hypothetical protein
MRLKWFSGRKRRDYFDCDEIWYENNKYSGKAPTIIDLDVSKNFKRISTTTTEEEEEEGSSSNNNTTNLLYLINDKKNDDIKNREDIECVYIIDHFGEIGEEELVEEKVIEQREDAIHDDDKEEPEQRRSSDLLNNYSKDDFDRFVAAIAIDDDDQEQETKEEEEEEESVHENDEEVKILPVVESGDEKTSLLEKEDDDEEEKLNRIVSHSNASTSTTTTTAIMTETNNKETTTENAFFQSDGDDEENAHEERRALVRIIRNFVTNDLKNISIQKLTENAIFDVRENWKIEFEFAGLPFRYRFDFTVENFRNLKKWTYEGCSGILSWLQKRRRIANMKRQKQRDHYMRSVSSIEKVLKVQNDDREKKYISRKARWFFPRLRKENETTQNNKKNETDKAPNGIMNMKEIDKEMTWKEKEEDALLKILNARSKQPQTTSAMSFKEIRNGVGTNWNKYDKDKIARRATILLHYAPRN